MKYKGGVMRGKLVCPYLWGPRETELRRGRGTTDEEKNLPTYWQMNKESSCDE